VELALRPGFYGRSRVEARFNLRAYAPDGPLSTRSWRAVNARNNPRHSAVAAGNRLPDAVPYGWRFGRLGLEYRRVEIQGVIHSSTLGRAAAETQIHNRHQNYKVWVLDFSRTDYKSLVDCTVRVRGLMDAVSDATSTARAGQSCGYPV
jgi:hypothetical protein